MARWGLGAGLPLPYFALVVMWAFCGAGLLCCCPAACGVGNKAILFFMDHFDFLCGPYGLMGLTGVCALLLLYVRHLFALRRAEGRPGKRRAGPAVPDGPDGDFVLDGFSDVMGRAKEDVGVSVVSADEFGFSDRVDGDQLGLLADVQVEIREICQVLADRDGTKEDFFSMFALVKEKYPRLAGHPLRASLEHFIRAQVPFFLSVAELESLWD